MLRRLVPWLIVFEVLRAGRDHWDRLDPGDRAEVSALMRRTHGNPRNLTDADRRVLRDLGRRRRLGHRGAPPAPEALASIAVARLPARRAIPWAVLLEVVVLARDHWDRLTP